VRACYEGPVFDGRRVAWEYEGERLPEPELAPSEVASPEVAPPGASPPEVSP
jgi:hypothetical protein